MEAGFQQSMTEAYVLAFDTSNETVAVGIGRVEADRIEFVCGRERAAHRASNTVLLEEVDAALAEAGISKSQIAGVVCGRGPGSFTGVRICMATAKGIASALEVPLYGVSTLDAVAWGAALSGVRGQVAVVADAMRKEVYPALFSIRDLPPQANRDLPAEETPHLSREGRDSEEGGPEEGGLEGIGLEEGGCDFEGSGCDSEGGGPSSASGAIEVVRLTSDVVVKAAECSIEAEAFCGDALTKYRDLFEGRGEILGEETWQPTGAGLIAAANAAYGAGEIDLTDRAWHGGGLRSDVPGVVRLGDPAVLLPVYTRLSDAEENERIRLAKEGASALPQVNLHTGVQDPHAVAAPAAEVPDVSAAAAPAASGSAAPAAPGCADLLFRPLDSSHVDAVAALEASSMGSDAWNASLVADELGRKDRTWWMACAGSELVGYCGGFVVDGDVQILKVATEPAYRRHGVARKLMALVASDARDLGATTCSLEVRDSNIGAQAFYETLGLERIGVRPRYYSDHEDAAIMQGPLPVSSADGSDAETVAGMELIVNQEDEQAVPTSEHPLIIAIESSCDETAAAVIDGESRLLSDVVASQIDFHSRFGGVVPEIASRKHIEAICGVAGECLDSAARTLGVERVRWRDLDAVAVTYAPGLVGALVVGLAFAKGAAWGADLPLIAVNHLEGHLYANRIATPDIKPPMVVSLVSGGHTMLVHVKDWGDYETLGSTIDDAVGEAFDKVAKALGLGYPGGPIISRLAEEGNPKAIDFPRALMHSGDLRFSLSGLKTAVTFYIQKQREAGNELNMPDIAASFQQAVIDVQVSKAKSALLSTGAKEFCLGGGVAANPALRAAYEKMCASIGVRLTMPPMSACTDNAAMIAEVAHDRFAQGRFADLSLDVKAHAPLDEPY